MQLRRPSSAFSLLETLIALAVIGILAAVGIAYHRVSIEDVRVTKLEADIATINAATKTYLANGGSFTGLTTPQEILDKMKTVLTTEQETRFVGIGGSMIDARLAVVTAEGLPNGRPRAVWNASARRFELASTGSGISQFVLDAAKGRTTYGTEARDTTSFTYNAGNGWVWNYNEASPLPRPTPTLISVDGLPDGEDEGVSPDPTPWEDPVLSILLPPIFSIEQGTFRPSRFPLSLQLTNPNPAATSRILVSVGSADFVPYGGPLSVPANTTVEAFAAGDPTLWFPSPTVSKTYTALAPEQLATPTITPSHQQFQWETSETITVSISNPNSDDYSSLEYRIGEGGWIAYGNTFDLNIDTYPDGAVITARAISSSTDYTSSQFATASIAAAPDPLPLLPPTITSSHSAFIANSVDTISVSIANLNEEGSALEYKLQSGNWQAYNGSFQVTRTNYPDGLTVSARCLATSRAYRDSETTSTEIGLTAVQLRTPTISPSAPNFMAGTVENITVTITNPNTSDSILEYRLSGGAWMPYSTALTLTRSTYATGVTVEARARATSSAFENSSNASAEIGLTAVPLLAPSVSPSAPNFVAGSVDSITITVTDPNPSAAASALEYRLNSGAWTAYSAPFPLARSSYPSGVQVEARARTTSPAYLTSDIASINIGLTPVQLRTPAITPPAATFMAGATESISVTVSDPNTEGSTPEYRLAGGAWQSYTGAFSVSRADWPTGLLIEARARATSPAFRDSELAVSVIGLTAVQLRMPTITPSASSFMAGTTDSITVAIAHTNASGIGVLEYRLGNGSWQTYSSQFRVTRTSYPSGLSIEARVRALTSAFVNSDLAIASLPLIAVQLQPPAIQRSAASFMAASVESVTITLVARHTEGGALEYRVNSGSWQAYSAPFSVTRANYPTGVPVEARARNTSTAFITSEIVSAPVGLTPVQLQTPTVAKTANYFIAGSVESVTVTLTNPNPSGVSILDYRLNGGSWQTYSTAFPVTRNTYPSGVTVEARARTVSAAYLNSANATSSVGLDPVQLQAPVITPSAPNFVAGLVETISVSLTDPNSSNSALEYRLNGGAWQAYSSAFNLTRSTYPSGLTIDARARSTNAAFSTSPTATRAIGLTPVQLQAPSIATSASNFSPGTVDSVTVTLTNPNNTGSTLDYRLNGGAWQAYLSAFPVTRSAYATGVTIEARARSTDPAYSDSTLASATIGLSAVRLQPPSISPSASNFAAGSVETISVTLTDSNAEGSTLQYRLAGGSWQTYSNAFNVTRATYASGVLIESRARATSAAYTDSSIASSVIGLTPVQLRSPSISLSSPNFLAGSVETISVTITNPNSTGSALDYRINNGSWVAYSSALSVSRSTYPNGLTVEARARSTNSAYVDSNTTSTTIGLTVAQLRAPSISPSAPDFMAGSVETISVTISNPNSTGSALDYRLNGGTWQAYSTAFSITRSAYPSGLMVEARARATNSAFADSDIAAAPIGLARVKLLSPTISPSATKFVAGSRETISVTISNRNSTGSSLQYRINAGSWVNYSSRFNVTRSSYPNGLSVEARALATSTAYTTSDITLASIGLTAVPLQAPVVAASAPNFMAGSRETITVTVTNPNPSGSSSLQYRINTGSWTAYSSTLSFTRSNYPSGLTVEARALAATSAYINSGTGSTTIGLTPVQLLAPSITRSAPNFVAGTVETVSITISNPNPTGSTLQYRLAGGSWLDYSSSFNVTRTNYPSGVSVEARAVASNAAYTDSTINSTSIGLGAVQLQAPVITPSAPNFMAGSVETVSVTVSNPNPSGSSTLEYRINTNSWQSYTGAFSVSRSTYPSGLTVEARATTSSAAYLTSASASASIGLTRVQLTTPNLSRSASNFMAGSVETISISMSNPNVSGVSVMEYRINGGSWLTYSSAFNVTRSSYPTGLSVEGRARSTSAAYSDSAIASTTIGLTPVPLRTPNIRLSAQYFVPTISETVTVTLINPHTSSLAALDYRLNGGAWTAYSAPFPVSRSTYPSGLLVEARCRTLVPAYVNSSIASSTIGLKTNVTKATLTFTSLASSAGYLNEAYIYINGDAFYLGNSDSGAGNSFTVDIFIEPGVTNAFDLTIDTYIRSGGQFTSGPLRGLDTRNGSRFTLLSSSAPFSGQSTNSAKIKDLSSNSNLDMTVGYEDLIVAGGNPDWDYDDFFFRITSNQNIKFTFGGYAR